MIGFLPTQALAFLAVFVYATHATQAIVFEWKPGFIDEELPTVFEQHMRRTDVRSSSATTSTYMSTTISDDVLSVQLRQTYAFIQHVSKPETVSDIFSTLPTLELMQSCY